MVFIPLINNIALLLSLSILYSLIARRWDYSTLKHRILAGVLFGIVAVAGMMNPLELLPGVIFDGRSIILSIGGLFGGPITAAISAIICGFYRYYLGGTGTIMGISLILSSALLGVIYYYIRRKYSKATQIGYLFLFGLVVHINMLVIILTLPSSISYDVLKSIAIPVIVIYPIGSFLMCWLLIQQESSQKTLELLKNKEENYRVLVEKASSYMVKLDRMGHILFINSFAQKEFGYKNEELIGKSIVETIIPIDDEGFRDFSSVVDNLLQKSDDFAISETQVICKNGERKWVSWTYRINTTNNNTNLLEILCVGNDVTQKKNAELALLLSERKHHLLSESFMDAYVRVDMGGKILDFNQAFVDLMGYSKEELLSLTYTEITPSQWHPLEHNYFNEEFFRKGYTPLYEKEYIKKNGEITPIEIRTYLITDSDSKPCGMWGIVRDISYRKETEKELLQSEEKLRSLFRVVPAGIGVVINRTIIEANDHLCLITGYAREELLNRNTRFLYPSDEEYNYVGDERYWRLQGKDTATFETKWKQKDGTLINVILNFTPYDPTNLDLGITFTAVDITERKHIEQMLLSEKAFLNSIIENNPMSIMVADKEGHFVKGNQAYHNLFKTEPSPTYSVFTDPIILSLGLKQQLQDLREGKVVFFPELTYNTHDVNPTLPDNPVWIRTVVFPISDSNGVIENYILIHEDVTIHKNAQQALVQSDLKFKSIIDLAADAILVGDPKGIIIGANQKAFEITGYPQNELLGKNISELFLKKELESTPLRYDLLKEGKIVQNIRTITKKDSGDIIIEMNSRMMPDGTFTAFIRDVSERLRNEQRIRENELKFRTLFETANDSIFLMDGETFVDCNEKTLELYGCTREQIIGKKPYEFSPEFQPDGRSSIDKAVEKINATINGQSQFFEWKHKKYDGTLFDAEVSLNKVEIDNKQFIQAIVRDITHRKRIESELEKETTTLNDVIDLNPLSIQIVDKNGYTIKVNKAHTQLFGAVPPKDYSIFEDPLLKKYDLLDELLKVKKGEIVLIPEFMYNVHELNPIFPENPVWIKMVVFPIFDKNHQVDHVILMHENITQQKLSRELLIENEIILKQQNEEYLAINEELNESNQHIREINEQLIKATEKAQESDRLKTAFLANMSHEIRTPMNGIVGFCELLQRSNLSKSELESYVGIIINSSNQLLSIINDIIDISKIEAGQVSISLKPVNIKDVISDLQNVYSIAASKKGIKLTITELKGSESFRVNIDETKLKQIISNLLNNAIKFTDKGEVELAYVVKNNCFECFVKDMGIGIAPENHSLIFERFRQVEGANLNSIAGTGLGLSISKSLVELMGGKIWVESELEKGAKFNFNIPVSLVPSNKDNISMEVLKQPDDFNFDGKVFLLVEDDHTNMHYLKSILKNTKAIIVEAFNGKEAIDIIKGEVPKIDIILIDIKMPIMNGIEATRIIKSICPEIPIIVQTAYALPEEKENAMNSGCDDYIAKPINRINLLQMITKYIS